jgi:hypothetical protein
LGHPALFHQPEESKARLLSPFRFAGRVSWVTILLAIAAMQSWSAVRGGFFIASNWNTVMSDRHVLQYKKLGDEVRQLSCIQKNIELSVFPINPIVNFVTGIPPASRYVFMYPWVAEIGQQELIHELSRNPSAVVWINTARKEGSPDAPAAYMADTIDFLNKSYVHGRERPVDVPRPGAELRRQALQKTLPGCFSTLLEPSGRRGRNYWPGFTPQVGRHGQVHFQENRWRSIGRPQGDRRISEVAQ